MADDILHQLQNASDGAKKLFLDIWNGGEATEEAIVSTIRNAVDSLNHALGLNVEVPGLSKPVRAPPRAPPSATVQQIYRWISTHPGKSALVVAVLVSGIVYGGVQVAKTRSKRGSRKARRTKYGARKEVIVMIGGPGYSAMTRSLALDLEVRGFIVYIVVSTHEDMLAVQKEARSDIKPLYHNAENASHAEQTIRDFHEVLDSKQPMSADGRRRQLELCGIVVAPEVSGTHQSVDRIPVDSWSEFLSSRLAGTITTVTSFLPLAIEHQARVVILTPSISHSLNTVLHAMEATAVGALESFARSLRRELAPSGVPVSHLQLGSFDFGALLHGTEYQKSKQKKPRSQPRILHEAVFDALTMKSPVRSCWLGRGATMYGILGSWAPVTLVDWMVSQPRCRAGSSSKPVKLLSNM